MKGILVNGEQYELLPGMDVEQLLADYVPDLFHGASGGRTRGMAVALNDTVVPRSAWSQTTVNEGDRVEIVTAVPGG